MGRLSGGLLRCGPSKEVHMVTTAWIFDTLDGLDSDFNARGRSVSVTRAV